MAAKKGKTKPTEPEMKQETVVTPAKVDSSEMDEDGKLDPAEEKMLDRILMGVVIFILGWLGLSIILVVLGYFGVWK